MSVNQLATSINLAGLKLFKNKFEDHSDVFSPLSCHLGLTGVLFGTAGGAQQELSKALEIAAVDEKLVENFKNILTLSNYEDTSTKVSFVNAIYIQDGWKLKDEYLSIASQLFDVVTANFRNAADEANNINQYVSEHTAGKMNQLLLESDIDDETKTILVNALYFKSKWHLPFEQYSTKQKNFTTLNGTTIDVQMMYQTETFPYYEDSNVHVIKLAYEGKKYSMLVVLPKNDPQYLFPTIEQYNQYCKKCEYEEVKLYFPKFKHEVKTSLVPYFNQLGVSQLFDVGGLQNMHPELKLDDIIHAVFIDVDENGTEAAASTAIMMCEESCCLSAKIPKIFNANKTFSYLIRDTQNNVILFAGVHNG